MKRPARKRAASYIFLTILTSLLAPAVPARAGDRLSLDSSRLDDSTSGSEGVFLATSPEPQVVQTSSYELTDGSIVALGGSLPPSSTPDPVVLSDELYAESWSEVEAYIKATKWGDSDHDFQLDILEYELANKVRPYMQWSEHENADDPIVLFQVHPRTCTGPECPIVPAADGRPKHRYEVRVRFGFIWLWDGGYGGSADVGWCPLDDHPGDTQWMEITLVSMDARTWHIVRVVNGKFEWPSHRAIFQSRDEPANTHVVIYFAAGKHHQYFDAALHDKDSPYSDNHNADDCNDLIIPDGSPTIPTLSAASNVGEKDEASHLHPPFAGPFWGTEPWSDQPFLEAGAPNHMWIGNDPVLFSGPAIVFGDVDGGAPDLVIYYREADATNRPWSTVPVHSDGQFAATLSSSQFNEDYLFRPVSSDRNFISEGYHANLGQVPTLALVTTNYTLHLEWQGEDDPHQSEETAIERTLIGTTSDPDDDMTRHSSDLLTALVSKEEVNAIGRAVALLDVTDTMVAHEYDTYPWATDAATGLPPTAPIRIRLYEAIDLEGEPAQTAAEATQCGPPDLGAGVCLGDPVQGAEIELSLLGGAGFVDPDESAPLSLITDEHGDVRAFVQTGNHPGRLHLRVRVRDNPSNPWLRPVLSKTIEVQPHFEDDDYVVPLRPRLLALPLIQGGFGTVSSDAELSFEEYSGSDSGVEIVETSVFSLGDSSDAELEILGESEFGDSNGSPAMTTSEVCCQQGGDAELVPSAECSFYQLLPADQCEMVCCSAFRVPVSAYSCEAAGGSGTLCDSGSRY